LEKKFHIRPDAHLKKKWGRRKENDSYRSIEKKGILVAPRKRGGNFCDTLCAWENVKLRGHSLWQERKKPDLGRKKAFILIVKRKKRKFEKEGLFCRGRRFDVGKKGRF